MNPKYPTYPTFSHGSCHVCHVMKKIQEKTLGQDFWAGLAPKKTSVHRDPTMIFP